jgi:hypothetical protein
MPSEGITPPFAHTTHLSVPSELRHARGLTSDCLHLPKEPVPVLWTRVFPHGTEVGYSENIRVEKVSPEGESEARIDWIMIAEMMKHHVEMLSLE